MLAMKRRSHHFPYLDSNPPSSKQSNLKPFRTPLIYVKFVAFLPSIEKPGFRTPPFEIPIDHFVEAEDSKHSLVDVVHLHVFNQFPLKTAERLVVMIVMVTMMMMMMMTSMT